MPWCQQWLALTQSGPVLRSALHGTPEARFQAPVLGDAWKLGGRNCADGVCLACVQLLAESSLSLFLASILVIGAAVILPGASAAEPPTTELKTLAFAKQPAQARALFEERRPKGQALGAEWLEAMSWVGRAGAIGGDWNLAADYSELTLKGCELLLESRPLDDDPNGPLSIATGAAIETLSKFYDAMDDRGQAVAFLREQLQKYADTSIETRLNKNLLLLDLAGKPMPPLDTSAWLGSQRFEPRDLSGKVTLFFFWAHWCEDCEDQKPVLLRLQRRYGGQGLRIVAPTRLYGYVERGHSVSVEVERGHIQNTQVAEHPLLSSVAVPISRKNFVGFGVSSTPTLVLVGREGVVRLYHPGFMEEATLAKEIEELL